MGNQKKLKNISVHPRQLHPSFMMACYPGVKWCREGAWLGLGLLAARRCAAYPNFQNTGTTPVEGLVEIDPGNEQPVDLEDCDDLQ